MSEQIAVNLRECHEPHVVLHHVLAADEAAAAPWIARWEGLASTKAGRTEVVTHPLNHPQRIEEVATG